MKEHEFLSGEQVSVAALRRIVTSRNLLEVPELQGDHRLNPDFKAELKKRQLRPAAVLIPIIERESDLNVILTKRAMAMKSHSGQVAFPGGKIDASDDSVEDAALREAHEEIALDPSFVEVLGRLPDYHSGSGYKIAPVIGLVNPNARLSANPAEVDYIFEVPLTFLLDSRNHRKASRVLGGKERHFYEMPYDHHYIWGVTAGIIRLMQERLFSDFRSSSDKGAGNISG